MAAVYWFKYGGKNYVDGGWASSLNLGQLNVQSYQQIYLTIDVTPSASTWNKIRLDKSSPNCIWIDVFMTSLSSSSNALEFELCATNSSNSNIGSFTFPDGSNGQPREAWYAYSGFWGAWAGHNFSSVSTTYRWVLRVRSTDGSAPSIYSSVLKFTIGLGYPVPSAETTITTAKAQQYSEMLSQKRYSQLAAAYKATAGNAIKPEPYLGSGGYYSNSNIAKDKIIYNARQTEIINFLGNGTTRRSAET